MIRRPIMTSVLLALSLALSSSVASAQFLIFWDTAEGDWNASENWFEEFGPPDSSLGDIGVVSNGGLAFLDSPAAEDTGGVVVGERGGENGTLHIRSGGELTAVDDLDVNGDVRVGQAGLGTLIIDRGGSLVAESLRSGGHTDSSIWLGGGSAGSAEVTVGSATLGRHTRVTGPDVSFQAESLNLSGSFTAEILGEQHSTLDVRGAATLGGSLDLQFAPNFQPAVGQTWDLIDAETINGNFSSVTSNVTPGPGLAFTVNKVEGGSNGMLAQLGIDARLQLTINRRTGSSQIQNLAEGQALTINGYGVVSTSGILDDGNWKQFDSGGPWAGNGSNTHVAELSLAGAREIGAGDNIDLGDVYAFQSTTLGDSDEDVHFEYHIEGGDVVGGLVDFVGPHNDVVLVVTDQGAYIQNQSTTDVTINGYAILSEAGSLDPTGWTSLSDEDSAWAKANPADNHLTELNLGGTLTLPATSAPIALGPIVSPGASDLEFVVNMAESGPHVGTIEYDDGIVEFGAAIIGDCNSDGDLTASDLSCVRDTESRDAVLEALNTLAGDLDGDGAVAFADFLVLSTNFGMSGLGYHEGNVDLTGGVEFADFLLFSANFGQQPQAAAVPEPGGVAVVLWPLALVLVKARQRRKRNRNAR